MMFLAAKEQSIATRFSAVSIFLRLSFSGIPKQDEIGKLDSLFRAVATERAPAFQ
jgi:hypothetical protein